MAIAFRSASSVYGGTLNLPAGAVAGDFLLLALTRNSGAGGTISTPAGWTLIRTDGNASNGGGYTTLCWKIAVGGETVAVPASSAGTMLAYTGVRTSNPIDAHSAGTLAPSSAPTTTPVTTSDANHVDVSFFSQHVSGAALTWGGEGTQRSNFASSGTALLVADHTQVVAGATPTQAATCSFAATTAQTVALKKENLAPNAPLLVSPIGAVVLDSTSGQRLDWTFSDSDSGDTQSKYDLRYRLVGAASWTDLTGTTSVTHRDVAAGFFPDGDYEWQVRTYDAVGLVGPYSASSFFTVATPPPGPSITDPINGGTVAAETYTVVWSSPDQDAYQLRVVADDGAGAPDETSIRYDTGTVTSTAARSASVPFPTNGVTEHIQLRVQDGGLWSSPYTTVWVDVSYTAPPTPTVLVTADSSLGAILVQTTHPAPTGSEPAVTSQDIYRVELDEAGAEVAGTSERVAAGLTAGEDWWYYAPASGVSYGFQVQAQGDNGTSSLSAVTG